MISQGWEVGRSVTGNNTQADQDCAGLDHSTATTGIRIVGTGQPCTLRPAQGEDRCASLAQRHFSSVFCFFYFSLGPAGPAWQSGFYNTPEISSLFQKNSCAHRGVTIPFSCAEGFFVRALCTCVHVHAPGLCLSQDLNGAAGARSHGW